MSGSVATAGDYRLTNQRLEFHGLPIRRHRQDGCCMAWCWCMRWATVRGQDVNNRTLWAGVLSPLLRHITQSAAPSPREGVLCGVHRELRSLAATTGSFDT